MQLCLISIDAVTVAAARRTPRNVDQLAASIREIGLLHPILVTEQMRLVAGGNRLAACKLLGWSDIPAQVVALSDLDAELAEIDENLIRNELTVLERAEQIDRRKSIYEAKYPESVRPRGGRPPGNGEIVSPFSQDTAAKTGFSPRTIQHDVQIANALQKETKDLIRSSPLADHKVQLLHLARVHPDEQVAVAAIILRGDAHTVGQARRSLARQAKAAELKARAATANDPSTAWQIIVGDCLREMCKLPAESVQLIVADPPYNLGFDYGEGPDADRLPADAYLAWCREWMTACVRLLTPDGSLWVLISDEWADHFGVLLRDVGLTRRSWIKWYETFGVNCINNFNRCSRHLFYCVKDPSRFVFNADAVTRPSARQERYHDKRAAPGGKLWDNVWTIPRLVENAGERMPGFPTQLPLALLEPIILCASDPADQVLDPFLGSGTTGVAALRHDRHFVGIERNPRFAELATLRLKTCL